MKLDLNFTFLELGDVTSRNLEFSHGDDVWVSYGEETITETNLLEITRRHPRVAKIFTFPKGLEAINGADWEWHIVGSLWTLRMRVQAKRVQRNGVLKVKHTVRSSGEDQRDLLIAGARADRMKPVYCIYCTEPQRKIWAQEPAMPGFRAFQTGCLLASAQDVPGTTVGLGEIEKKCRPWHYLFAPEVQIQKAVEANLVDGEKDVQYISIRRPHKALVPDYEMAKASAASGWHAPAADDLNGNTKREFDWTGVQKTTGEDLARLGTGSGAGSEIAQYDGERLRRVGVRRMMVLDVRGDRGAGARH